MVSLRRQWSLYCESWLLYVAQSPEMLSHCHSHSSCHLLLIVLQSCSHISFHYTHASLPGSVYFFPVIIYHFSETASQGIFSPSSCIKAMNRACVLKGHIQATHGCGQLCVKWLLGPAKGTSSCWIKAARCALGPASVQSCPCLTLLWCHMLLLCI